MIMKKEKVRGEVVLYQPNDTTRLEVRLEQETVWLTQDQISVLFGKDRYVITKHNNKIFDQGELDQESNVHFLHITNFDKKWKQRNAFQFGFSSTKRPCIMDRLFTIDIPSMKRPSFVDGMLVLLLAPQKETSTYKSL